MDPSLDRTRRIVERNALINFAGPIAEATFAGRKNRIGAGSDVHGAVNLIAYVCHEQDDEIEAYVELLEIRARHMVPSVVLWSDIEVVAAALLEKKRISGRAVRKIIFDARRAECPLSCFDKK